MGNSSSLNTPGTICEALGGRDASWKKLFDGSTVGVLSPASDSIAVKYLVFGVLVRVLGTVLPAVGALL